MPRGVVRLVGGVDGFVGIVFFVRALRGYRAFHVDVDYLPDRGGNRNVCLADLAESGFRYLAGIYLRAGNHVLVVAWR